MDQPYISHGNQTVVNGWLFQEAVELQREREALELEKEKLQKEKEEFEQLQEEFEQLKKDLDTERNRYKEQKKELDNLRTEIRLAKSRLENSEKSAAMQADFERQRQERSEQLFQMKWKMLEEELMKLAEEKKEFERMKRSSTTYTNGDEANSDDFMQMNCSVFFTGVHNELALKKRYRDLLKIFHPDNIAGDHDVVVSINKEFEAMKEQFTFME